MKPARLWILGVVLVFCAVAGAQESVTPPAAEAEDAAARALAVYEQGKQLYDARDYEGALARFDEAAALEPDKARWQYNRGLALRKLGRTEEARGALLQSRALDPDYKRAEIDDKLGELSARDTSSAAVNSSDEGTLPGVLYVLGGCVGFGFLFWGLWRWLAAPKSSSDRYKPTFASPELRAEQRARLQQAGEQLIQVEHALRIREDADLRAQLNQATLAEQRAYESLENAERGIATPESLVRKVDDVAQQATRTVVSAKELFGEEALRREGERVGCYFCARPLANGDFRMRVPLKRGAQVTEVLACPPCANMVAAGQPPPVKVRRMQDGRFQHWSEILGYDPYAHRHQPLPNTTRVPAWEYTPSRSSLGEVAAIAAGGALATGLAAYGVSQLLDLDSASEAAAARAATEAAAKKASVRREERDWKDHS